MNRTFALFVCLALCACNRGGGESEEESNPDRDRCTELVTAQSDAIDSLWEAAHALHPSTAETSPIAWDDFAFGRNEEQVNAILFGTLPADETVSQAKVSIVDAEGLTYSHFMRTTNTTGRSSRDFDLTVGEFELEVNIGETTDIDTEESFDSCSFNYEQPIDGGGSLRIGMTFRR